MPSAATDGFLIKLTNCRLCVSGQLVASDLWFSPQTGRIVSPPNPTRPAIVHDLAGRIVTPGFIDVQINGGYGVDFSEVCEDYGAGVEKVNRELIHTGVTSYLPTLTSQPPEVYQKTLPHLAARGTRNSEDGAESLGAHCEGPFISPLKSGIHTTSVLQAPTEGIDSLAACYGAANLIPSTIRMVTLAPELDGAGSTISSLLERGIVVSAGHSNATYEQMVAAVMGGVKMITHLFNAIPQPHHRTPGIFGILGAQGGLQRPYYGLIVDGIHVHPSVVRVAWGAHPEGVVLVSDAMRVVGLEDGLYAWTNGEAIMKRGNRVTLGETDRIAGSGITLLECLENFVNWTGASVSEGVRAITEAPAGMLGLGEVKGCLKPGADADLVVLEEGINGDGKVTLRIEQVWKFGERVFGKAVEKARL